MKASYCVSSKAVKIQRFFQMRSTNVSIFLPDLKDGSGLSMMADHIPLFTVQHNSNVAGAEDSGQNV